MLPRCELAPNQGVEGIRKVFIREAKRTTVDAAGDGSYRTDNEWMLDTEGVNLLSVMCHPDVDYTRTVSNHLIEIIDVLGIEAARNALMKVSDEASELCVVQHVALLTDLPSMRVRRASRKFGVSLSLTDHMSIIGTWRSCAIR